MPTEPRFALEPTRFEVPTSTQPWALWAATAFMGVAFALGFLF